MIFLIACCIYMCVDKFSYKFMDICVKYSIVISEKSRKTFPSLIQNYALNVLWSSICTNLCYLEFQFVGYSLIVKPSFSWQVKLHLDLNWDNLLITVRKFTVSPCLTDSMFDRWVKCLYIGLNSDMWPTFWQFLHLPAIIDI